MAKKATSVTYDDQLAIVVSSRYFESCNATKHTAKLKGKLHPVWQDGNNPAPIGAEIAISIRSTDGKAFLC